MQESESSLGKVEEGRRNGRDPVPQLEMSYDAFKMMLMMIW